MEIGIGEEYKLDQKTDGKQESIPFGHCQTKHGWLHHNEVEIFLIYFDYG